MITGYAPFNDRDIMAIYSNILSSTYTCPTAHHISRSARSIIKKLLHQKPSKRLGCVAGGAQTVRAAFRRQKYDRLSLIRQKGGYRLAETARADYHDGS